MEAEKVRLVSSVAEVDDEVLLDDLTDLLDQLSDSGSTGFESFFEEDTKELDVSVTAYEEVGSSPYLSTSEILVLSDVRPTFSDIKEFQGPNKQDRWKKDIKKYFKGFKIEDDFGVFK